jgi:hypothetical protein
MPATDGIEDEQGGRRVRNLAGLGWTLLALASLLATGGCASLFDAQDDAELPASVHDGIVTVHLRWAGDDPLPTARRYCAALGGSPRPLDITNYRVVYDCATGEPPPPAARRAATD